MLEEENKEEGFFSYGFKLIKRGENQIEFQPATIIKDVPKEFVIMQMQVYLDDLKEDYHNQHGRKQTDN